MSCEDGLVPRLWRRGDDRALKECLESATVLTGCMKEGPCEGVDDVHVRERLRFLRLSKGAHITNQCTAADKVSRRTMIWMSYRGKMNYSITKSKGNKRKRLDRSQPNYTPALLLRQCPSYKRNQTTHYTAIRADRRFEYKKVEI
jgi:hypothetical protein